MHRSFSAIILLTNLWIGWTLVRNLSLKHWYARFGVVLVGLVLSAIVAGVTLDRLGFPAVVQPLHLLLANLIFGAQFAMFVIHHQQPAKASLLLTSKRQRLV